MRDAGTAFLCQIGAQQVWVPLTEIRYGSDVAQIGDRGRLIVSRWSHSTSAYTDELRLQTERSAGHKSKRSRRRMTSVNA